MKSLRRLAILMAIGCAVLLILRMSSSTPASKGVVNGQLVPCPESPNCVCSFDSDKQQAIEPFRYQGNPQEALAKLKGVIEATPRTRFISETTNYLHIEFRTAIFRFVDDVEFLMDATNKVIHVRSASRVGRSDLGTNRRRIESLRMTFNAANP